MAAFLARDLRCVDADLYGRIGSGPTADVSLNSTLSLNSRPVYFWSGADGLAKYLRYGPPPVVGLNMSSNNSFAVQDFASANFTGLQEFKNGQALISNIGYSATDWSLDSVFTLVVISRAAVRAQMKVAPIVQEGLNTDVAGLPPTWANVKLLYE